MVNRIIANCGLIAAGHGKGPVQDAPFIEIVAWTIAIHTKADRSFWQEVLLRYPNECYRCLEPVCICDATGGAPKDMGVSDVRRERIARGQAIINAISGKTYHGRLAQIPYIDEPPNLDQVSNMLSRIYRRNDTMFRYNPDSFFVEIMRSSGRLADAMSKADSDATRERIVENTLSLFAWVMGYWRLATRDKAGFSPNRLFLERYQRGCPICGRKPCKCGDNRYNRLTSFDIVAVNSNTNDPREEFRAQLRQLNELLAIEKIETVPENTSDKKKDEVLESLAKKREALEEIEKSSEAAVKIGKKIAALATWVSTNWPF